MPGAEKATLAAAVPLFGGGFGRTVFLEGQDASDPRAGHFVQVDIVSPTYLQTVGIPLLRGRGLSDTDQPNTPNVVVINEAMAKQFWPNEDPIGRRFKFFGQANYQQVVGVAKDSKYNFIGEGPTPYAYQSITQVYSPAVSLFVRSSRPETLLATMRTTVQQLDRNLPLTNLYTLDQVFDQSLWAPRMGASLLAIFAGLSLVLAVIGIYGVMAYSVTQRTREIGIRMALGASRQEVLGLIVLQGLRLALMGVVVGLAVALALSHVVTSLLYDVPATDIITFVSVPLVLALAALGASYLPALRATHIDPQVALRYE
jgi:predicted permease